MEMTSRERVLTAARRQAPDRVPREIRIEHKVSQVLADHFKTTDLRRVMKIDLAGVGPAESIVRPDYSVYFDRKDMTWDDWGRGRIWDREDHYAEFFAPLERAETVDDILRYPWPDYCEPYRYAHLSEQVAALHLQGFAVAGSLEETIFEIAWQLRSFERLFEDIARNDEIAILLLDQITERRVATASAYASAGTDIIFLGDDVAMQDGLMMNPKMWNQWFRPRLKRVIDAAKAINTDTLIHYHSDGMINRLIPDLIDLGVDILNPVQPECVDHRWVKNNYGDKIAFSGGLGVQSVLPFGTPDQVRQHVKDTIATLGADGGLIIGPSHVLERDTPLENILAMLEAIDAYG